MPSEDKDTKLVVMGIDGLPLDLSDTSNPTVWAMKRMEAMYALTLKKQEEIIDSKNQEINLLKVKVIGSCKEMEAKNATIGNYMDDKDKDLATIKNNLIQIKRLKNKVKFLEDHLLH